MGVHFSPSVLHPAVSVFKSIVIFQVLVMLSMVARRSAQAGAIGLRQFGTRSQPKNKGFQALKLVVGGAAGTGGLTLAFVGVGSAQPDWKQLRADIAELLNDEKAKNPSVDEGVQGGGGYLAPMMLRLAWHCSGTWCKTAQNGGSDGGTMRFCPDGRLPDGDKHAQHLRDIFYRMGFDDRGIVALSGAHAVGRCHTDRSGFWGPWTHAESTLSNEYYRLMFEEKWTPKKTHKGKQWKGPPQFENPEGDLMMLSTDLALVNDPKFRVWAEKYYKDEDLWFKDFAKYYQQLNELGCKNLNAEVPWYKIW